MADKRGVLTMTGDVTAAQAALFRQGMGGRSAVGGARKRRKTKRTKRARSTTRSTRRKPTKRRATPRRRTKKRAYLVKGSAAAKRHMAKLRRMRRK